MKWRGGNNHKQRSVQIKRNYIINVHNSCGRTDNSSATAVMTEYGGRSQEGHGSIA